MGKIKSFSKSKKLGFVGLILLLVSVIVIASTINYVASIKTTGVKKHVLEVRTSEDGVTWSSWVAGEDLDFVFDMGETVDYSGIKYFEVRTSEKYNEKYSDPITVEFDIVNVNDAMVVTDTSDSSIIVDSDTREIPTTGVLAFSVSIDITLWSYSGYDYSTLSVEVLPLVS